MNGKFIGGIILGILIWYFLFWLGVIIFNSPGFGSLRLGINLFVFLFSSFLGTFLAARFTKEREILVAFLVFFVGYIPLVYFQISANKDIIFLSIFKFARVIIFPYIIIMLFSLLGGFTALKVSKSKNK